jgi:hypothetical protein
MLYPPKTRRDAQNHRYGSWAANERGVAYNPKRCAYEIPGGSSGMIYRQCSRPLGHGPAALYCKQHAKRVGGEAAE